MITGPTRDLLATAWDDLGGDPAHLAAVDVVGDPAGLLPSRLHALPAMTAAVAASTLAASALDAVRNGGTEPPTATVDVEHVAVAAVSERHVREDSPDAADRAALFAPLSRFLPTVDGWLRLHANYPWHRERALAVLGADGSLGSVVAATQRWRGVDLEDALADAGAVGYAVRTPQEWAAHPQGRAVAELPLVELDGEPAAAGGWTSRPGRAAGGVRVLDLTRVIAGPVATRTLAAWGAEVLRLDSPHLPDLPAGLTDTLSGKRSALLDLAAPGGRESLDELLAAADVVVHGYRPGALDRLGLAPDRLRERHPHLVVASISAWGSRGPWARRRGFDSLVQAPTGIAAVEGDADAPGALPAQVLDHATGYLGAAAVLLALAASADDGVARHVRLSLGQTARWLTSAGTTPRPDAGPDTTTGRLVDPARYLVDLPGGPHPIAVVAPPGRLGDVVRGGRDDVVRGGRDAVVPGGRDAVVPAWSRTTRYGTDRPTFP